MSRFSDANQLVDYAESQIDSIQNCYRTCLEVKEIDRNLPVMVKNFLENIRSSLDYCAAEIHSRYGKKKDNGGKTAVYFPIIYKEMNRGQFEKFMESKIPGVLASNMEIASYIWSIQSSDSSSVQWSLLFNKICNQNKHVELTPQERKETRSIDISSVGASISMGQGASISLGTGASIRIGNLYIPGGQVISSNSPAKIQGVGRQRINIWVSFVFKGTNVEVQPFLKESIYRARRIISDLASLAEK